jgi:Tfp pilus assembly protein PilF
MSLLMQALRKAESAKKQRGDAGATPETPDAPDATAAVPAPEHAELTLEVKEPSREDLATAREVETAREAAAVEAVDYFSSEVPPARPTFIAADNPAETAPQGFDPDRGFAAPPVAAAPLPEAAPPVAAEPVPQAPPRAPETAARLKLGLEQQKQADAARDKLAAQSTAGAVFAAKARSGNRRPLLIAACGLLLLAAAGGYGYYQFMLASQPTPLTAVVPPPESPAPVAAPAVAATAPPAAPASAAPAAAAPAPLAPAPVPHAAAAPAPRPAATAAPAPARTRVSAPAPASAARDPASISVVRNDPTRQVNPTLKGAYQSFVAGDAAGARSQYQRVLQQEPDNRDALLGMAAIAVNRGQAAEAGAFYTRLLELDPTDVDAASGLASVQHADPSQAESNLKKVLANSPLTASAHFALGNVYAEQQRWSEAQQAYFQAVGAAPANADYVFNLAVSLDRLGQKKLALASYQRALQLAQGGAANVNQAAVQTRIGQLRQDLAALPQ